MLLLPFEQITNQSVHNLYDSLAGSQQNICSSLFHANQLFEKGLGSCWNL